jgi:hypothetical protein
MPQFFFLLRLIATQPSCIGDRPHATNVGIEIQNASSLASTKWRRGRGERRRVTSFRLFDQ